MNRSRLAISVIALAFYAAASAQGQIAAPVAARKVPGAATAGPITAAGRVLLPNGYPAAAGVAVYIGLPGQNGKTIFKQTVTDSSGRFKLTAPGGHNAVGVAAVVPGRSLVWRSFTQTSPSLKSLTLKLESGASITGKIVRLDGSAAANLDVSVASLRPGLRGGPTSANEFSFMPGAKMLPDTLLAEMKTRSGRDGRFTIAGLPRATTVKLRLSGGLQLTPGSSARIELAGSERTYSAGILAAMKPASLRVTLIDHNSGKPVPNSPIGVTSTDFVGQAMQSQFDSGSASEMPLTDAAGKGTVKNLAPGEHTFFVRTALRKITIPDEGAVVDLTVHTGALAAKIIDSAGKPVPGAVVEVQTSPDLSSQFPFGQQMGGMGSGREGQKTGKDGTISLSEFPWDSSSVTIRARRGNDLAEWSGNPAALGKSLEIPLKPGALVTVSGRLVDTHRQPVTSPNASLIRWQDGPRITWFNSAQQVKVSAAGGFKIEGLRRGEGFSVVSGGPFGGMGGGRSSFESPRFTTASAGQTQDLGDVIVHPLEGPEQLIQLYGFDSRQQLATLGSLRPQPDAADVKDAMDSLRRYMAAHQAGDIDSIHRFTSIVSPGWSADRKQFLLNGILRTTISPATLESARPMRFVAGISLSYLMLLNKLSHDPTAFFAFGAAAREMEANPNWVAFASTTGDKPTIAGLLRQENGDWKVVNTGFGLPFQQTDDLFFFDRMSGRTESAKPNNYPAPQPDSAALADARSVAERYLQAWASGKDSVVLALTSPLDPIRAKDIESMRETRSQRIDDGVCPIGAQAAVKLEPITGLTSWELAQLVRFSAIRNEFSGSSLRRNPADNPGFPEEYIKRGDIVPFKYQADGREFYLLMARQSGKWAVFEPSIEQVQRSAKAGIADSR